MWVLRLIGAVVALGCTAALMVMWLSFGIPQTTNDVISCIAITTFMLIGIIGGVGLAIMSDD